MGSKRDTRRPPYPALSTSSSAFQNSNNSISSARSASSYGSTSAQMPNSPTRDHDYNPAPLPSPTLNQEPFFSSMSQSMGRQDQQQEAALRHQQHQQQLAAQQMAALQQYQQYQQQQQQHAYQQHHQTQTDAGNYTYQPDRKGSGATAGETNSYINQYALVAEAAKRAQMAVLERDFGGVDLS